MGNHAKALETLVHVLNDTRAAEVYCMLGGEVVSCHAALTIASSSSSSSSVFPSAASTAGGKVTASARGPVPTETLGLKEWYRGLFDPPPPSRRTAARVGKEGEEGGDVLASAVMRQKSVKEETKKKLLTDLVGVYMRSSPSSTSSNNG